MITYEQMQPYQKRVADEARELRTKLDKLNQFVQTEMFNQLPAGEKERLLRQRLAMDEYANVLSDRIEHFS